NDSAGRFTALPFTVRTMWRFEIPQGPLVLVATLLRQINQEATPLEERTLIVAERAGTADADFAAAYSERSYGNEETIESRDVLGAALFGANRVPTIVLERDYGDAAAFSFVERGARGAWRTRWTSGR